MSMLLFVACWAFGLRAFGCRNLNNTFGAKTLFKILAIAVFLVMSPD